MPQVRSISIEQNGAIKTLILHLWCDHSSIRCIHHNIEDTCMFFQLMQFTISLMLPRRPSDTYKLEIRCCCEDWSFVLQARQWRRGRGRWWLTGHKPVSGLKRNSSGSSPIPQICCILSIPICGGCDCDVRSKIMVQGWSKDQENMEQTFRVILLLNQENWRTLICWFYEPWTNICFFEPNRCVKLAAAVLFQYLENLLAENYLYMSKFWYGPHVIEHPNIWNFYKLCYTFHWNCFKCSYLKFVMGTSSHDRR